MEQAQQAAASAKWMQPPHGYEMLNEMRKDLQAKRPMVGTEEYSILMGIESQLRSMEQAMPVHHSSKAWWDGVHEMD